MGSSPYNIQIVESVWGDAIKTGTEGWDDGNIVDGDGWSKKCAIEANWNCSGGDSMHKDKWSENIDQGMLLFIEKFWICLINFSFILYIYFIYMVMIIKLLIFLKIIFALKFEISW